MLITSDGMDERHGREPTDATSRSILSLLGAVATAKVMWKKQLVWGATREVTGG